MVASYKANTLLMHTLEHISIRYYNISYDQIYIFLLSKTKYRLYFLGLARARTRYL
jgi:hypothetical protein